MKVAQPMEIVSIHDYEAFERGISLLTGFIKRVLLEKRWESLFGINQQLCLMSSAMLCSEQMIQRPPDLQE